MTSTPKPGTTAGILSTGTTACPVPEAQRHYCRRCGHSGDYLGTGPHAFPGCDTDLQQAADSYPQSVTLGLSPWQADPLGAAADVLDRLGVKAAQLVALLSTITAASADSGYERMCCKALLGLAEDVAEGIKNTLDDTSYSIVAALASAKQT